MKRTLTILASLLLLCGCGGTKAPEINAPGLSGIGKVKIGQTLPEAVSFLSQYEIRGEEGTSYSLCSLEGLSFKDLPELKQVSGRYQLTDSQDIGIFLSFYRDTLVYIMTHDKKIVREALIAKYGDGDHLHTSMVDLNIWVGETATATYNRNDGYKVEYMQVIANYRDIETEVKEYIHNIKEEKDSQRTEELRNGI